LDQPTSAGVARRRGGSLNSNHRCLILVDRFRAADLTVAKLTHPTFPESAGGTSAEKKANTKKMLTEWNGVLPTLHAAITHKDVATPLVLYGEAFADADKVDIPSFDLPPGTPPWMYDNDGWAKRAGTTVTSKRANITITVPATALP
jgi:hypothetical protein